MFRLYITGGVRDIQVKTIKTQNTAQGGAKVNSDMSIVPTIVTTKQNRTTRTRFLDFILFVSVYVCVWVCLYSIPYV